MKCNCFSYDVDASCAILNAMYLHTCNIFIPCYCMWKFPIIKGSWSKSYGSIRFTTAYVISAYHY